MAYLLFTKSKRRTSKNYLRLGKCIIWCLNGSSLGNTHTFLCKQTHPHTQSHTNTITQHNLFYKTPFSFSLNKIPFGSVNIYAIVNKLKFQQFTFVRWLVGCVVGLGAGAFHCHPVAALRSSMSLRWVRPAWGQP